MIDLKVCSAGLEPHGVDPFAQSVMSEIGYAMSEHRSKHIDLYFGKVQFDYLISVCGEAERRCPYFPGMGQHIHWEIEDPAAFHGTDDKKMRVFRQIRDLIKAKVEDWFADLYPNEP